MSEDAQPPQSPKSPTGDGASKFGGDVASPVKGRNVLIPVDGSPDSERAFIWYVNNMKRPSDNVRIYHRAEAVSLPLLNLSEGVNAPFKLWETKMQERIKKLQELENHYNYRLTTNKLAANGNVVVITNSEPTLSKENLAAEICQEADKFEADMIVMATTGWGSVRKKLFKGGSVANYVVQMSLLPVMLVPTAKNEMKMQERRQSIRRDSNASG